MTISFLFLTLWFGVSLCYKFIAKKSKKSHILNYIIVIRSIFGEVIQCYLVFYSYFAGKRTDFMPEELQIVGLKQVFKQIHPSEGVHLGDDFLLIDVADGENLEFLNYPFRADAYFFVFCREGGLDVEINLKKYTMGANVLLVSIPGSILRVITPLSKNVSAGRFIVVAFSKDFLSEVKLDGRRLTEGHTVFSDTPCIQLGEGDRKFLLNYVNIISDIMDLNIPGARDALGSLFSSIFYVISGLSEKKSLATKMQTPLSSSQVRLRLIFDKFMDLVAENHTSERGMSFYANHLGLTPKYLSKLVKQYSGKAAPDWIDSFVILEAKNMLKYTGASIKEIVYKLHFPNPSVFYRFFKTHTGLTPSEYRNG